MNSKEIYDAIEKIANTSSKNEKLALVKGYAVDGIFRSVLVCAYDPFRTYGIAAIPTKQYSGDSVFDALTWVLLDRLASRDLTGNNARHMVQQEINRLNDESSELFRRILKKDLRAGFSASTINKAVSGLIPKPPYMRCCLPKDTDLSKFDWKTGVISQEKADGMFANINYEDEGLVSITSRQGSPFPSEPFADLMNEVEERLAPGAQYHGELLVRKGGKILPREQSNGVLNSILKGGQFEEDEHPIYQVWDGIPLDAVVTKGKHETYYSARLKILVRLLNKVVGDLVTIVPTRIVHSLEDAYKHYSELLKKGKEGTVIKDPRAIWRDGTSKSQCKLKLEVDVDLLVVGFLPGEGKNASTFGSVLTQSADGLLEVAVSGFTDSARQEIHAKSADVIGTIMTVKANSIMRPAKEGDKHSLFLPRYVEFRTDKTEADTLQRVIDQFDSAVKAA